MVDGIVIGWLGELHPRLVRQFELPRAPVAFELELPPLLVRPMPAAVPVPKLPAARRDLAVVVDDAVPAQDILAALDAARPSFVDAIRLFDVYRGPGIPAGKKSLAILVLMQDTARTLTDAEIDATVAEMLRVLAERFSATLRQQDSR